MNVGDRVQTLTGRHGIVQSFDSSDWRVTALVLLEGDEDPLKIPVSCLVPSPVAHTKSVAGGGK